jgi:protein SCO1/2
VERIVTRRFAIGLVLVLALAACARGGGEWRTKNVTGLLPDLEFSMTDDRGRRVSAADERGAIVLLFFGYTNCPDVCPTTLARLGEARKAMRNRGAGTRMLFVTVDPARDTEARLAAYVRAFGEGVVGLRGGRDAVDALARRYRVGYSLGAPDASGQYEVTHSGGVFVFDRDGRARLLIRPDDPLPSVIADLDRLAGS